MGPNRSLKADLRAIKESSPMKLPSPSRRFPLTVPMSVARSVPTYPLDIFGLEMTRLVQYRFRSAPYIIRALTLRL